MTRPPVEVLAEFGVDAECLRLLPGGQGTTWSAGEIILKPTDDPVASAWIAEAVASLKPAGYRVPQPAKTHSDGWVFGGWCAWYAVDGRHGSGGRWSEILGVARALHRDLSTLPRPDFLERRTDAWAVGDRAAWGDQAYEPHQAALGELIGRCSSLCVDEELNCQVVHADLYGNVLFQQGQTPAVIDLSPYWRPTEYALAVAAVDALAWFSAEAQILQDLSELPALQSLLARAAIFRLVTADQLADHDRVWREPGYVGQTAAEFEPVVDLIARLPS